MATQPYSLSRKKKILVLVSRGGGGHKTAAEALKEILGDAYHVEINYVFEDSLRSMDTLNLITRGHFTSEDLYNTLLRNHQKKLLEWMVRAGKIHMNSSRVEKVFDRYLSQLKELPDLIISPTPFINYGVACAAQKYDIPFIIIPTDLDGSTFLHGFPENPTPLNFKLALAYDDPLIRESTLQGAQLRDDQILISGFPVRTSCCKKYTTQEKRQICSSFNLFESHATVTLVMGAVGGNLLMNHVKSLTLLDPRIHGLRLQLNVCTGHNTKVAKKIGDYLLSQGAYAVSSQTFILPTGLVVHVRGFIPNLIELMAVSDLIITKTGSCTVNEAIYLDRKVLLDNTDKSTARYLAWEQFNIPFVEKYGLGTSFSDSRQLPMLIPSLLKYPEKPKCHLERPLLEEHLPNLVRHLLD